MEKQNGELRRRAERVMGMGGVEGGWQVMVMGEGDEAMTTGRVGGDSWQGWKRQRGKRGEEQEGRVELRYEVLT